MRRYLSVDKRMLYDRKTNGDGDADRGRHRIDDRVIVAEMKQGRSA